MLLGLTQDSKSMRYPYPPLLPPQSVRSNHQGSTLTFYLATGEDLLRTNRKESFPRLSGQGKLPFLLPCPSPHHVRLAFDSHSKNSAVTTQKDATGRKLGRWPLPASSKSGSQVYLSPCGGNSSLDSGIRPQLLISSIPAVSEQFNESIKNVFCCPLSNHSARRADLGPFPSGKGIAEGAKPGLWPEMPQDQD